MLTSFFSHSQKLFIIAALEGDSETEVSDTDSDDLSDRLSEIEDELDQINPLTIPQSREDFARRLQELMDLNKRLAGDQNFDGIGDYKRTEQELDDIARMLEREAAERALLEAQIMALKSMWKKKFFFFFFCGV